MKYALKVAAFVAALAVITTTAFSGGGTGSGIAQSKFAAASKSATTSTTTSTSKSATTAALVDINSASRDELMKVPGIGEAIANKIIAGRPWKQKSDLLSKGIANKGQYEKMKSHIIAKQK
jgi:competence protein ComEA